MLSLDAKEWAFLEGGYRKPYDASVQLRLLESANKPDRKILDQFWENLYHQGDVGVASYAAIPQLSRIYQDKKWLDFHLPGLAASIEEARFHEQNPAVPDWLIADYRDSLKGIAHYCLSRIDDQSDRNFARALLLLVAILCSERGLFDLIEFVDIGDEAKALALYETYG
jgi:hypothetical protein